KSYQLNIPEIIDFSVDEPQAVVSQFSIHSPAPWLLRRPQFTYLSFAQEEMRGLGESSVASGIKTGTVKFNDTSWPIVELREGDLVSLNRTESGRIDARAEAGAIHVTLSGSVGSVTLGDPLTRKELAPSYLEYLYNTKSLAFFWSAVVFLWGLIWS